LGREETSRDRGGSGLLLYTKISGTTGGVRILEGPEALASGSLAVSVDRGSPVLPPIYSSPHLNWPVRTLILRHSPSPRPSAPSSVPNAPPDWEQIRETLPQRAASGIDVLGSGPPVLQRCRNRVSEWRERRRTRHALDVLLGLERGGRRDGGVLDELWRQGTLECSSHCLSLIPSPGEFGTSH
jgi:hypothetical protein